MTTVTRLERLGEIEKAYQADPENQTPEALKEAKELRDELMRLDRLGELDYGEDATSNGAPHGIALRLLEEYATQRGIAEASDQQFKALVGEGVNREELREEAESFYFAAQSFLHYAAFGDGLAEKATA